MLGEYVNAKIKCVTNQNIFLETVDFNSKYDVILDKEDFEHIDKSGEFKAFIYMFNERKYYATTKKALDNCWRISEARGCGCKKIWCIFRLGAKKDLFMPSQEYNQKIAKNTFYLVYLYVDTSKRLCATMRVKEYLKSDSDYDVNDWVSGTIITINNNFGAFVAVDNKYDALIPNDEIFGVLEVGEIIKARVYSKNKDGKLNLTLRDRSYNVINEDKEVIFNKLSERGGFLPYNDYTDAQIIRKVFKMSKSSFKRAIGSLLKDKKITIKDDGIYKTKE